MPKYFGFETTTDVSKNRMGDNSWWYYILVYFLVYILEYCSSSSNFFSDSVDYNNIELLPIARLLLRVKGSFRHIETGR